MGSGVGHRMTRMNVLLNANTVQLDCLTATQSSLGRTQRPQCYKSTIPKLRRRAAEVRIHFLN
jgi:hypothetical protein